MFRKYTSVDLLQSTDAVQQGRHFIEINISNIKFDRDIGLQQI